jgi:hypothetical protein
MDKETDCHLPFLERPNGSLGHKIRRKHTHNEVCSNFISHHHAPQKSAVLSTLVSSAGAPCDQRRLYDELKFVLQRPA